MSQQFLFEKYREQVSVASPTRQDIGKERLSGQNLRLLRLLQLRPHTNDELIALRFRKYTSRISDIRSAGYAVIATDLGNNVWSYRLVE